MEHEHALEPGHRLQEYEIVRLLGHGGFGITYLAYDTHLDQHVALKEYLPNDFAVRRQDTSVVAKSSTDQEDFDWGLRTFLNEAKTLARFKHPNLIQVYRYLEAHNTAYIVMEYAEGQTLSEILKAQKTLSEPDLKGLLYPLLDGLEQVHRVGILHRDIKPGNIIIRDKDQSPVLIDFGAARHALGAKSKSLTSIITAGYSPIEQYTSKGKQGPWTDIYSLGAVCYRAITGEAAEEAADRILNDELIPAVEAGKGKASDVFLRAIDVALRNRHEERPQMISEWRTMLLDEGVTGFENSQGKEPILDEIITEQNKDHERVITLDNESPDREEEAEINLDNIEGNSQRTNKKKPVLPDYEGLPPPKNYHKYIATLVIVCLLGAGLFYLSDYRKKPESIPVIPDNEIVETEDVQIEQEAEELISNEESERRSNEWYKMGEGFYDNNNISEAFKWYRKAAGQGHVDAQYMLGSIYAFDGRTIIGVPRSDIEAEKWYRKAAEKGDANALFKLALMYEKGGYGVGEDYFKSMNFYRKAADLGHKDAKIVLELEEDLTSDKFKRYAQSAIKGEARSQSSISVAYSKGEGAPEDDDKAFYWGRKAALQEYAYAQYLLGYYFYHGKGIIQNYQEAAAWYRKAAELGVAGAQHSLGEMYESGLGVPKNAQTAAAWYRKSVVQGYDLGYLDSLCTEITSPHCP